MTIIIDPPFWQRWWFRLLSMAIVAMIFAIFYRYRRERKRELEHTRQQIADDLHDDIGSKLSAVRLYLSRVQSKDRLSENDQRRMQSYSAALERMTGDLRDVVWLADPEFDTLASLCERMADFARKLTGELNLEVDMAGIEDNVQLKMNVRRHLFYMVKESLHNAVKHAGATRVILSVRYEKPALRIRIEDDGQGFDPSSIRMGQGLRSIPRRAGEINAELTMASVPNRGTTVDISLSI